MSETIDHGSLAKLVEAGAVRAAHVVGQAGGWAVLVKYGLVERPLAAQRSRQVRLFRKFETLVAYLKDLGIVRYDVDAIHFDPAGLPSTRRPDRSAALKKAHDAAAHREWFLQQVDIGLAEADNVATQFAAHDDVKSRWGKRRTALLKAAAAE